MNPPRQHQPKATITAYWTEVHGDRVLLTMNPPTIAPIKHTTILDAFSIVGEQLDVRHLCREGTRRAINSRKTGKVLAPLTPTRVRMTFEVLDEHLLVDDPARA